MTIFVVFKVAEPAKMHAAILSAFPQDHLRLQDNEWLISGIGTAKDISDKLNISPPGGTGSAIVFSMANYYGRATTETWDWIKAKAESSVG